MKLTLEQIKELRHANDTITRILCELEGVEPPADILPPVDEKEKLFFEIIDGGKWDGDYYINNGGVGIIYNGHEDIIYIDYILFWSKFYKQFNMKHGDVQLFMKDMLFKNFKIDGKTPHEKFIYKFH